MPFEHRVGRMRDHMARNINLRTRSAVRTQSRKDVRPRGEKYKLENKEYHLNTELEGRETTWREI